MAWRVARSLDTLLRQLNARYPSRNTKSDGSIGDQAHAATRSEHNPDGRGIVRARDFTHDPARGVDIDRMSDELAASRDDRILYVIANAMILDSRPGFSPWTWRPYHGSNPHRHHLHLSVVYDNRADDPRPWNLPMLRTQEDDMTEDERRLLQECHRELTLRLPSRSAHAGPKPFADTMLGNTLNADARAHEALVEVQKLRRELPEIIRRELAAFAKSLRPPADPPKP